MTELDVLYKRVFELEEENKIEEANGVREKIRKVLNGEKIEEDKQRITEEQIINAKKEFFYKTRKKAFHKNLREQLSKDDSINDIELALAMTSMLTHSLIEMKQEGKELYQLLEVNKLTDTVSKFLSGELSAEEVQYIFETTYNDFLFSKIDE
ncbi:MAG: hypothetical protein ACOCRK_04575 [bacterium]